ncbi:hypothetical protein L1987_38760 [Smallanthus sonchifolius]|uniref:Uncharacterized protein n=1 Tax=Smallanthus sonchifolius TaxID=185202 RepID=A0ACB9HLA7_9ASTR|nr:hypothetical protein L1987_38760 [Smallanthus sonchifolius]
MDEEIHAVEKNKTWVLTSPPLKCNPIGLEWVYKVKRDAVGNVTKYKARLVAKGYVQQLGIDFAEAFAPVVRIETIRLILALSAKLNWKVFHMDVKATFLHGELKESVYVKQPEGYGKKGAKSKLYKLSKALYGLRHAPRAWNLKLDVVLKELGFKRYQHEQAVYVKSREGSLLIIGVYVDDLFVTGSIEVAQIEEGIVIKQTAYASKVVKMAGLEECIETKIPMEPGLKLYKTEGGAEVNPTLV